MNVTGLAPLGGWPDNNQVRIGASYQFGGSLSWVTALHTIKLGVEVLDQNYQEGSTGPYNGLFRFLGRWSNAPFADFLLGIPESTQRLLRGVSPDLFNNNYGAYMQDDLRVSSRLTLNLGLRYELMEPLQEQRGQWMSFVPSLNASVVASDETVPDLAQDMDAIGQAGRVLLARDIGLPRSLVRPHYRNFAPRMGFAWRPFGGNKTVLRGGYGIFFAQDMYRC